MTSRKRAQVRWWPGRFDLLQQLEHPSVQIDDSIERLPCRTLRQHSDLRRYLSELNLEAYDVLGYQARASGAYGFVRVAALFPWSPFEGYHPEVFALDGDRHSKHRNPPFDDGEEGVSAWLCLYYRRDPKERQWWPQDGLLRLFDMARAHLEAEHIWRRTEKWPLLEAAHGNPRPARPRPGLQLPPLRRAV